jgi:hypothetical protein
MVRITFPPAASRQRTVLRDRGARGPGMTMTELSTKERPRGFYGYGFQTWLFPGSRKGMPQQVEAGQGRDSSALQC